MIFNNVEYERTQDHLNMSYIQVFFQYILSNSKYKYVKHK